MRAVELFCGAGGMSRGLAAAGIKIVKAYDVSPAAVANYLHNVGPHAEEADLSRPLSVIPTIMSLAPDVICGGPPCQDYSTAGKGVEGANAELTLAYAVVIAAVRPEWFLMENVPRALTSKTWKEARAILKRAGYGISETKIDCSFYGVPQARHRAIVVGRLGEIDGFIEGAVHTARAAERMTLRKYFYGSRHRGGYFALGAKGRFEDFNLIVNGHLYSRPFKGGRGVRTIDEPLPTVTRTSSEPATDAYLSAPHPADPMPANLVVQPSLRQIQEIQGFPPDWKWVRDKDGRLSKREIRQMIANGVPAPTAKIIGQVLLDRHLARSTPEVEGGFHHWLRQNEGLSVRDARNEVSYVRRARRLLRGRTFSNEALELAALRSSPEFEQLGRQTKSNLATSIGRYRRYLLRNAETVDHRDRRRDDQTQTVDLTELMSGVRSSDYHLVNGATPDDGPSEAYAEISPYETESWGT
ncbi:DNA cytosine methyltransferase [Pseudorhizobium flavum]|uniref:DNA (cytosine-5-)-methyltransferase n=1 Tax=Pseudorhizobium flavum TaxID=1335061 RepID=A0A7X0DCF2_9HYPH|nr:DNA cytosine methyltransferase [Pseudorhizobium flavum]MBB6179838.1 DNA (cytosine-5)-methyltransferase 1 [Pseudorhizobium flavum]CAD6597108.1 DNA cytosine methyltransferase [Pseudorhizobium flavum]